MTQSPSGRAAFTLLLILLYSMIHHSSKRFAIFKTMSRIRDKRMMIMVKLEWCLLKDNVIITGVIGYIIWKNKNKKLKHAAEIPLSGNRWSYKSSKSKTVAGKYDGNTMPDKETIENSPISQVIVYSFLFVYFYNSICYPPYLKCHILICDLISRNIRTLN